MEKVSRDIFCVHFWGDRLKNIPEKTKNERYVDYIESEVGLGRYIVLNHRLRPGMLVKIKPMFGVPWIRSDKIEEYVGIYMDQVHIPRAGERWFTVFHNGELKEVLDYEVYEVLIETL